MVLCIQYRTKHGGKTSSKKELKIGEDDPFGVQ
jgi:hypothetical protein